MRFSITNLVKKESVTEAQVYIGEEPFGRFFVEYGSAFALFEVNPEITYMQVDELKLISDKLKEFEDEYAEEIIDAN